MYTYNPCMYVFANGVPMRRCGPRHHLGKWHHVENTCPAIILDYFQIFSVELVCCRQRLIEPTIETVQVRVSCVRSPRLRVASRISDDTEADIPLEH